MFWYALFVKTGYEQKFALEIKKLWNYKKLNDKNNNISNETIEAIEAIEANITPFIPLYDAKFRRAGRVLKEKRRLFPGYVFIETNLKGLDFFISSFSFIYNSNFALKILRNGRNYEDDFSFYMEKSGQELLMRLFNNSDETNKNVASRHCIEMSIGIIEGNKVRIIQGPLMGYESIIKKVKRHRMEAVIEIELFGDSREITVGLEVIERI